jgi:hypothetical protein
MARLWVYWCSEWWSTVFPLLTNWNCRIIHSRNLLGMLPIANFRWNESPLPHLFWSYPLLSYCIVRTKNNLFLVSHIYWEQYMSRSGPDHATALELLDLSKHISEEAQNNAVCQLCNPQLFCYSIAPLVLRILLWNYIKKKKKLHGLSPRVNYTDRATAACRRSDCQLLRIEGATWSAWRIPTAVFSVF